MNRMVPARLPWRLVAARRRRRRGRRRARLRRARAAGAAAGRRARDARPGRLHDADRQPVLPARARAARAGRSSARASSAIATSVLERTRDDRRRGARAWCATSSRARTAASKVEDDLRLVRPGPRAATSGTSARRRRTTRTAARRDRGLVGARRRRRAGAAITMPAEPRRRGSGTARSTSRRGGGPRARCCPWASAPRCPPGSRSRPRDRRGTTRRCSRRRVEYKFYARGRRAACSVAQRRGDNEELVRFAAGQRAAVAARRVVRRKTAGRSRLARRDALSGRWRSAPAGAVPTTTARSSGRRGRAPGWSAAAAGTCRT